VNGQNSVARVVGVEIEAPQLGLVEAGGQPVESLDQVLVDTLPFLAELQEDVDLAALLLETVEEGEVLLQALLVLVEGLRPFLILPDFGRG